MNVLNNLLGSDAYTPVNKHIARAIGFNIAGYLGEMIRQRARFGEEQFFFSQEAMEDQIGMSPFQQRGCLAKLVELGRVVIEKKGLPYKNYYIINDIFILELLNNKQSSDLTTSSEETAQQAVEKLDNIYINKKDNNKKQISNSVVKEPIIPDEIPPGFDELKKVFVHARKYKKQDAIKYLKESDYTVEQMIEEAKHLKLLVDNDIQDPKFIPGFHLRIRDFVPTDPLIIRKQLENVCFTLLDKGGGAIKALLPIYGEPLLREIQTKRNNNKKILPK